MWRQYGLCSTWRFATRGTNIPVCSVNKPDCTGSLPDRSNLLPRLLARVLTRHSGGIIFMIVSCARKKRIIESLEKNHHRIIIDPKFLRQQLIHWVLDNEKRVFRPSHHIIDEVQAKHDTQYRIRAKGEVQKSPNVPLQIARHDAGHDAGRRLYRRRLSLCHGGCSSRFQSKDTVP